MNKFFRVLTFIHLVMVVVFTIVMLYFLTHYPPPPQPRLCAVAEISPDISPEERERCRLIRGHKL